MVTSAKGAVFMQEYDKQNCDSPEDLGLIEEIPYFAIPAEDYVNKSQVDKSIADTKKHTEPIGKDREKLAVFLSDLTSQEQRTDDRSNILTPYFSNVNLTVFAGETWAISSNDLIEARLLSQVIGNMRHYRSGLCQLGPLGTMKAKRHILPHIFYIDTHEMIYPDKTVLEQFMFATGKIPNVFSAADRQLKLLRLLESMDMGYISLSLISDLYNTEKLLLELLIASESNSRLIVCDWTGYTFSQPEIEILAKITERLRYLEKAVIIATMQPKLIGIACDNTLYLYNGQPVYSGKVKDLYTYADKVAFVLQDNNAQALGRVLSFLLPGWRIKVSGNNLYLHNYTDKPLSPDEFYRLLSENALTPQVIKVNKGRVANSFEELVEQYGLQKQSI